MEPFLSLLDAIDELEGRLAVAVSGGVDSVALLTALRELGHDPTVLHFHHGTRAENDEEWELVKALAGKAFRGHRLDLKPGPDLQLRARRARYAVMDAAPFDTICLGHHLDDQAETVLDRLCRGAGAGGLSGMPRRRGRYLRPWLALPRTSIVDFARSRGLRWMEDPTNRRGTRGVLRHEVLPELERLRPGSSAAIARSAGLLALDETFLRELAAPLVGPEGIDTAALSEAPEPLARRAVRALVLRTRGLEDLASCHIDAALAGRGVQLPGGWILAIDEGTMRCLPPLPDPETGSELCWGIWRLRSTRPVSIRALRSGERVGGASARERLRSAGIPVWARAYHPIVQRGTRLWLVGVYLEGANATGVQAQIEAVPPLGLFPGAGTRLLARL